MDGWVDNGLGGRALSSREGRWLAEGKMEEEEARGELVLFRLGLMSPMMISLFWPRFPRVLLSPIFLLRRRSCSSRDVVHRAARPHTRRCPHCGALCVHCPPAALGDKRAWLHCPGQWSSASHVLAPHHHLLSPSSIQSQARSPATRSTHQTLFPRPRTRHLPSRTRRRVPLRVHLSTRPPHRPSFL